MKVVNRNELIKMIKNNEDISSVDTSKVTDMNELFWDSQMTELPDSFNISKVRDMTHMFQDSKLSEKGYNKLLINLNKQKLNPNLKLDVSDLGLKIISKKSLLAKKRLINKYNWEIIDDGDNIQSKKENFKDINIKKLSEKINIEDFNLF